MRQLLIIQREKMAEELIYLYCITKKVPKLKQAEDAGDNLYFIYYKGLYAVVSKVLKSEFCEETLKKNLANLEWVDKKARAHERVIEGVMKNSCVIPFKFATLFNSEDSFKAMFQAQIEEFRAGLKFLENKEEWGLKIYCDVDILKKNFSQADEELLSINRKIETASTGRAFFLRKEKEKVLDKMTVEKINECGQDSFQRLSRQSCEARINKLLPKELTEKAEEMVLNAAFLVEKDKSANFIEAVGAIQKEYGSAGFIFNCTGPWPAYNFCEPKTSRT